MSSIKGWYNYLAQIITHCTVVSCITGLVVASTGGSAIKMVGLIATPYAGLDCFKNLVSVLLSAILISRQAVDYTATKNTITLSLLSPQSKCNDDTHRKCY